MCKINKIVANKYLEKKLKKCIGSTKNILFNCQAISPSKPLLINPAW